MWTSRSILTAGAAVAVLVLALVVGLQLRDRGDTAAAPSGSPKPSATASASVSASAGAVGPTGSPSAVPTVKGGPAPVSVLDDRFGFIVSAAGAAEGIRPEGKSADVSTISGVGLVPSPTGDRVAYFSATAAPAIHIRTLADGTDRVVGSLAAGERPTSIAWSSDGTGLLFGTGSGVNVGASGAEATLQSLELSGGAPTVIARRNDGRLYAPIAWDRAAKIIAASEGGAGGITTAYLTFDLSQTPARTKVTPISGQVIGPLASSDAKYVLMVDVNSAEVRYWPIADAAAVKVAGKNFGAALWQPGTHNIGFITIAGDAFRLFGADDGSSTTVFQGLKIGIATQPGSSLRTFRADGAAVLLGVATGSGLGATDYTLIRLSDGASVTFQATGGLGSSVRLRP